MQAAPSLLGKAASTLREMVADGPRALKGRGRKRGRTPCKRRGMSLSRNLKCLAAVALVMQQAGLRRRTTSNLQDKV